MNHNFERLSSKLSYKKTLKDIKLDKIVNLTRSGRSSLNILELPDEVLLFILQYLHPQDLARISLCCQKFKQLSQDKTLWRRVDFRKNVINEDELIQHSKFFQPSTVSLAIRGNLFVEESLLTQRFLNNVKRICHQLKELILEEYYINGKKIHITDFPMTIEKLSLKDVHIYWTRSYISAKPFLYEIDSHMPNLTCLILNNCQWFTSNFLITISKIPKLKEFRLNKCPPMCTTYASVYAATQFGFKTLEILDLRNMVIGDFEIICFNVIETLTHIYLENSLKFGEQERWYMQVMLQQGVLLFPHVISSAGICALTSGIEEVRSFFDITHQILPEIEENRRISKISNLKTLVVRNHPYITDFSLQFWALNLSNISKLEYLDVTGTSVTESGVKIFELQTNIKVASSFNKT